MKKRGILLIMSIFIVFIFTALLTGQETTPNPSLPGLNISQGSCVNCSIYQNSIILSNKHYTANTDMVAWWQFTRNLSDFSGNGNNAYPGAVTHEHEYYVFSGNSYSYLGVPLTESLKTENFTFMAWIRLDDASNDADIFSGSACSTNKSYSILWKGGANNRFYLYLTGTGAGCDTSIFSDTVSLTSGKWHHFAITYNTSDARFYLDGKSVGNVTGINRIINYSGVQSFWIGKYKGAASNNPLDGSIDEIAIFNRTLNASEIASYYNEGLYVSNATYTSAVIDSQSNTTHWRRIIFNLTLPANSSISIYTMTTNDTNNWPGSWDPCQLSPADGPDKCIIASADARYLKFKINISSTNLTESPVIANISIMRTGPPSITLVSPSNASELSSFNVTFIYRVTDYQLDSIVNCSLLSFNVWLTNGNYNWTVRCYDNETIPQEGYSDTWLFTINNPAPVVSYVYITPDPATTSDTLTCVNGTTSNDTTALYYRWYKNGQLISGANSATLSPTYFSSGGNISCGIIPSDGEQNGTEVISSVKWNIDTNLEDFGNGTLVNLSIARSDLLIRFAHTTDEHLQYDADYVPYNFTWELFNQTYQEITTLSPDFIITTGDNTEDYDFIDLYYIKQVIDTLPISVHLLPGNHDLGIVNEYQTFFGSRNWSFVYKNALFIGLDSAQAGANKSGPAGNISQEQIDFLNATLNAYKNTNKIAFIFLHHHIKHPDITSILGNRAEVISVLERYNTSYLAILVFSGHKHVNYHTYSNGINYFITTSLTKSNLEEYRIVDVYPGLIEIWPSGTVNQTFAELRRNTEGEASSQDGAVDGRYLTLSYNYTGTVNAELKLARKNFIDNPGFETWDTNISVERWTEKSGSCSNTEVEKSTTRYAGNYALKQNISMTQTSCDSVQYVVVDPETNYTLSGWLKTSIQGSGECKVYVEGISGTNGCAEGTITYTSTTDWTYFNCTITTSASDTNLSINLKINSSDATSNVTCWWDNLQLEKSNVNTSYSKKYFPAGEFISRVFDLGENPSHFR